MPGYSADQRPARPVRAGQQCKLMMALVVDNERAPAGVNVCIADADEAAARRVAGLLGGLGTQLRRFASAAELLAGIDAGTACVVCDAQLPDMAADAVIAALRARGCDAPVIILAEEGDVAAAVTAMRAGALDFIEKAHADRLLVWHLRRLLENRRGDRTPDGD